MKFLFKEEIKKLISEAPVGTEPRDVITGLIKKGYRLEGISDFATPVTETKRDAGNPYVLTKEDIETIASMAADKVKVPVLEKVIEKTEVVREIPVVRETIKETIKEDSAEIEALRKEIESLKKMVKETPPVQYFTGGGFIETSIKSGTGTSVTKDAFGNWVISASSTSTPVYGEIVVPSGTSFTLAHTPNAGTLRLYRGGARQQEGTGKDFTMSGANGTLVSAAASGEVFLADYSY